MREGLQDRREAMLGRFADLALELAEHLQADALAADTAAERADLAKAFHLVGRTLRQTFAIDARLTRDAAADARQARSDAAAERAARVRQRQREVTALVTPLIWTEHEAEAAEDLKDTLEELIDEAAVFDAFLDAPLDEQVALIARKLGLAPSSPPPLGERDQAQPGGGGQATSPANGSDPLHRVPRSPSPSGGGEPDAGSRHERDYWNSA